MAASSGPQLEYYKDVEIRYGYDIHSDLHIAHFTLPPKQAGRPGFQAIVGTGMQAMAQKNPSPVTASTEAEVLKLARTAIDAHLV